MSRGFDSKILPSFSRDNSKNEFVKYASLTTSPLDNEFSFGLYYGIGDYVEASPSHVYFTTTPAAHNSDQAYTGYDPMDFTNWTKVTQPDGTVIMHYHLWTYEEGFGGKEIKQITSEGASTLNEIDYVYGQHGCNGRTAVFPGAYNQSGHCPTHLVKTVTQRDGATYTSEAVFNMDPNDSFYSYGNPVETKTYTTVTASTTPRVRKTEYEHNESYWILGLPTRMTLNDRELATYQYDNLGQRIRQSRYTQSDFVTFTYNNDGTIASYKDALNRQTEARNWKRGAPQTIIQAVGTADEITTTSVFDNNGWLSSKTDANGNRTSYSHESWAG